MPNYLKNELLSPLIGMFLLLLPAFYSGYPLVYSDTGTYIASGFERYVPIDRPIIYGLFIALSSLKISLWLPLMLQCFLLALILKYLFDLFFEPPYRFLAYSLSLLFLTAFSGIAWYASQIMPDLFAPLTIICLFLLLQHNPIVLYKRIIIVGVFVFSAATHLSIPFICLLVLGSWAVWAGAKQITNYRYYWQQSLFIGALIVLSWVVTASTNYMASGSFGLSKGSHVFLTGRMLDNGLLESYLHQYCATRSYSLCAYQDSLPNNSREFMWNGNSPVNKQGSWENTQSDYKRLLRDMALTPKYTIWLFINSIQITISQLLQNDIGSGIISKWYAEPDSPPYQKIAQFFPHEFKQYRYSRQNINLWNQSLDFSLINYCQYFILIACCCVVWLAWQLPQIRQQFDPNALFFLQIALLGIVANAAITANLSVVCDRLQARVTWLLPLAILIMITPLWLKKINRLMPPQ
jgi:hypothetical protein